MCIFIFLFVLWLGVMAWIAVRQTLKEGFAPAQVRERECARTNSLPIDLKTKYPDAFYDEVNNSTFETDVLQAIVVPVEQVLGTPWAPQDWMEDSEPMGFAVVFQEVVVAGLENDIRGTKVGKTWPEPFQVTFSRRIRTTRHATKPGVYCVEFEAVVYRESKYQGKHIEAVAIVFQDWMGKHHSAIVSAAVLGIVFEDQIALIPVEWSDSQAESAMPFDPNPLKYGSMIILDNEAVYQAIKKQEDLNQKMAEAELALSS